MKKFTGTILLTAALLTHVALTVATEESYIFSSADMNLPSSVSTTSSVPTVQAVLPNSSSPVTAGSLSKSSGYYSVDDYLFMP